MPRQRKQVAPTFIQFCTSPTWLGLKFSPAQRCLARLVYGEPIPEAEMAIYRIATGRADYRPPRDGYRTISVRAGASSGKTHWLAAPLAIYEALFRGHRTEAGEQQPVIAVMSQDRDAARGVAFHAIRSLIERVPFLREQLAKPMQAGEILFRSGMLIKLFPRTTEALQGYAVKAFIGDEFAHWPADPLESSAEEISAVVSRAMARRMKSKPRAFWISTPKSAAGLCWQHHKSFYGKPSTWGVHFWAPTLLMNPDADREAIAELEQMDPSRAKRFYEAEFASSVEQYIDEAWIQIMPGERGPLPIDLTWSHYAGFDAAGGSRDPEALAIVRHEVWIREDDSIDVIFRLVELVEWTPRAGQLWDQTAMVRQAVARLRAYGIRNITGDLYMGPQTLPTMFLSAVPGYPVIYQRPAVVSTTPSRATVGASGHASWSHWKQDRTGQNKSQVMDAILPLWSSGRIVLLDHPGLLYQVRTEERVLGAGTEVKYDHPRNGYDDALVAVSNAIYAAAGTRAMPRRVGAEALPVMSAPGALPAPMVRAGGNPSVPYWPAPHGQAAAGLVGGTREQRYASEEWQADRMRKELENQTALRTGEPLPHPEIVRPKVERDIFTGRQIVPRGTGPDGLPLPIPFFRPLTLPRRRRHPWRDGDE